MVTKKEKNNINGLIFEREKEIKDDDHDMICLEFAKKSFQERFVAYLLLVNDVEICGEFKCVDFTINEKELDRIREIFASRNYLKILQNFCKIKVEFEKPIVNYGVKGFMDIFITIFSDYLSFNNKGSLAGEPLYQIGIEVKSGKFGFGEIIREINYYKVNYKEKFIPVIISKKHCEFDEELYDQNIWWFWFADIKQWLYADLVDFVADEKNIKLEI